MKSSDHAGVGVGAGAMSLYKRGEFRIDTSRLYKSTATNNRRYIGQQIALCEKMEAYASLTKLLIWQSRSGLHSFCVDRRTDQSQLLDEEGESSPSADEISAFCYTTYFH